MIGQTVSHYRIVERLGGSGVEPSEHLHDPRGKTPLPQIDEAQAVLKRLLQ